MVKNHLPADCNALNKPHVKFNPNKSFWVSLIEKYRMKKVAEIGVLQGNLMWKVMKDCNVDTYYAVDPWQVYVDWADDIPFDKVEEVRNSRGAFRFDQDYYDKMFAKVQAEAKKAGYDNIVFIRKESVEAAKEFKDNSLDGIYIDSIHDFPNGINDLYSWLPKVKEGGVVAGHDYMVRFYGLIRAIDFVFGNDFRVASNHEGDYYSSEWYVTLDEKKEKYISRIKNKFPDPTILLDPQNKYMHTEKDFVEKLYNNRYWI